MRRALAGLMALLVIALVGFGGDLGNWSNDGTTSYSSAIVVQNVSDTAATVQITYQTPCDPTTPDYEVTVPPGTTQTVNVNEAFPGPWASSAVVSSDVPIVATSNIVWSDPSGGTQWAAHAGATPGLSQTWYLAEGSTYGGFQSYIAIQNPNDGPAQIDITYMTPGGTHAGPSVTVSPISQTEVNMADTLPDWSSISAVVTSDVPVVAQLSTYWNAGSSTASTMGTTMPSDMWYFAEGSTTQSSEFETWFLLQNPGPTAATVDVTYIANGSQTVGPTLDVPAMTHTVFNAADTLPDQAHFSAIVTSDIPIVAIQSNRWKAPHGHGYASTVGQPATANDWFFPSARPNPGASTSIAVQNVGTTSANVNIIYSTGSGAIDGSSLALDPFTRDSISLPESVDGSTSFSVTVTADQPILATQGSYWETGSGVHQSLYFGVVQSSTTWYVPITPHPPSLIMQNSTSDDPGTVSDRDGDGVPDNEDFCPDFPGSAATNGC